MLQNEQGRVGDLVAMLQQLFCCLDLRHEQVRLAEETDQPSDLCGLGRVMEGVSGGGGGGG